MAPIPVELCSTESAENRSAGSASGVGTLRGHGMRIEHPYAVDHATIAQLYDLVRRLEEYAAHLEGRAARTTEHVRRLVA